MTTSGLYAITADHVFDGTVVRERTAVVMDGARILDLVPTTDLPRTTSIRAMPEDAWLAPGFIDVQVNGGGDVLFNDEPNVQSARTIAAAHRRRGTTGRSERRCQQRARDSGLALGGTLPVTRKARRARPAPTQAALAG